MIAAPEFIEPLRALGYTQYAGVPCSFLKPFINYVVDDPALDYIGAASEGEAVGINLGAHLAGRKTVTLCQNSGLGNMVNPLTSLNHPFRVPTLLIITWRGEPGVNDEPQHEQMGRIMHQLLETLEIPWLRFPSEHNEIASVIEQAEANMAKNHRPFALVMSKDTVNAPMLTRQERPERVKCDYRAASDVSQQLSRTQAIELILDSLGGDEAVIATTGKTGREVFTISDRSNYLYVVGGMGTASAIGFGIAHALPRQRVVVLDGDGAALMKLGTLATIGWHQPENLLHIVLDNESHDSTGGQQTASGVVDFAAMAAAANYRSAFAATDSDEIRGALDALQKKRGPSLLHIKIRSGSPEKLGRPTVKPHEVKERFMDFLRAANGPS